MYNKVERVSNRPITKDTATADVLVAYGVINNVRCYGRRARRLVDGKWYWSVYLGTREPFIQLVSETRRRCLDGTLEV